MATFASIVCFILDFTRFMIAKKERQVNAFLLQFQLFDQFLSRTCLTKFFSGLMDILSDEMPSKNH